MTVTASELLSTWGFVMVLGTIENPSPLKSLFHLQRDTPIVGRGAPFSYDWNEGVHVIYDETGRPWINNRELSSKEVARLNEFGWKFQFGAYVPHSNDGGRFASKVLPTLH